MSYIRSHLSICCSLGLRYTLYINIYIKDTSSLRISSLVSLSSSSSFEVVGDDPVILIKHRERRSKRQEVLKTTNSPKTYKTTL